MPSISVNPSIKAIGETTTLIKLRWYISILLLLTSVTASGQCLVSGRIVDINSRAIPGSLIILENSDSKTTVKSNTDSLGYFKTELPAGTYNFRFDATEYKSLKGIIQLFDGDNAELGDIVMQRDDSKSKAKNDSSKLVVSGRVEDELGNPIEFAAVRFLTSDSAFITGVATDSLGQFTANLPSIGNYRLMVSLLTYNPTIKAIEVNRDSLVLPTIILQRNDNELAEVTVSAGYINRVNGHLQITPEKTLVKHAASGYQLLNNIMLPGVEVDPFDGIVSLYGHQVSLYINGQPADYRMIQNLRPKDVREIEYHDAPVGRYSTDFAAINFITKEQNTGGYVTLDAQQTIGGYLDGRYNGFAKINNGQTSYYIFSGYNLKNAVADKVVKTEGFRLQSTTVDRFFNSTGGRNRDHGGYGQFTIQHSKNRRFISVSAGVVTAQSSSTANGITTYSEPINIDQITYSLNKNKAISPKLSYYGQFDIRKNDLLITTLNTSYSHNKYNYNHISDENNVFSDTRDKMVKLEGQIMYQMKFEHRNTLSFILMDIFKAASTDYLGTHASKQQMWNSEALAFVEYTHQLTDRFRCTVRPGISMVNINLKGHEQHNFYFPRFFTQLTFNPNRSQQINFSLSIGNTMTSLSSRTRAVQPIDLIMSRRGNPDLKDVKLYDANISHSIQAERVNINTQLALSYNSDALTAGYIPENNRLIVGVYNGNFKRARFSPNITWKITDSFRGEFGSELCYMSYNNEYDSQHINYASANLSLIYFTGDFSFNLKSHTTGHGLNSEYRYLFTPANIQFSVAWTHGNWRVDAWAKSLSGQKRKSYIHSPYYNMYQLSHGRFCGMTKVAYTFDFGRKAQRERKKADTSIDSNIL